jgi:hypothetical protein
MLRVFIIKERHSGACQQGVFGRKVNVDTEKIQPPSAPGNYPGGDPMGIV